jgi:hypothetical protein
MLNPFSLDPRSSEMLPFMANPDAQPAASAPSPDAASPPAAAPVAGPSGGSGGAGNFVSGIGGALANAMQGGGLFSDPNAPANDKIDPVTGASQGQVQKANNQSLMKMGLMLLAAGARQSDDSRAKILSSVPGTLDNSDQLNNFAKSRLEMAKMRLLERQELNERTSAAAINAGMGIGGTPSPGASAVATPGAMPTPATALAQGPVPAAGGAPMRITPPGVPTAGGSGEPSLAEQSQMNANVAPLQGAPAASATPAMVPPPLPTKPTGAPPAPDFFRDASPGEKRAVALMPKVADKTAAINQWQLARSQMEVEGQPYIDTQLGQKMVPVYKNGVHVGSKSLGAIGDEVKEEGDKRITTRGGRTIGIADVREDPTEAANRTAENAAIKSDREDLYKTYNENVKPAEQTLGRLNSLYDKLGKGEAIVGTGADIRRTALNAMASAGYLNKNAVQELVNTNRLEAELGRGAGEFAKKYYGPQISNADVENANRLMGAVMSNNKDIILAGIDGLRNEHKATISTYQERADRHNSSLPESYSGTLKQRYTAPSANTKLLADPEPAAPAQTATAPAGGDMRAQAMAELERRRKAGGR